MTICALASHHVYLFYLIYLQLCTGFCLFILFISSYTQILPIYFI